MFSDEEMFKKAFEYANENSTCMKVSVGAAILDNNENVILSCNRSEDFNCKEHNECYKAKVTGIYESCEETRKYCKAIHAEINMINKLNEIWNNSTMDKIPDLLKIYNNPLYVTRYPCENCCKKIIKNGFKYVKYCGKQEISENVKRLFEKANVKVEWFPEIDYEFK